MSEKLQSCYTDSLLKLAIYNTNPSHGNSSSLQYSTTPKKIQPQCSESRLKLKTRIQNASFFSNSITGFGDKTVLDLMPSSINFMMQLISPL